ncbi:MAG: VWA domain-containing protein [Victivallales bacterium]|jgi:Ca-activated chloride channel homolog|nr:VWA domain-containing protein [Victivallales bacterium]
MTFARPWLLLFLPLVVGFAGWALRRCPPTIRLPSLMDLGTATDKRPSQPLLPLLLEGMAGIGLLLALAGPQRMATVEHQQRETLDIVLALDISGSMGAYDAPPEMDPEAVASAVETGELRPRLAVAKQELVRFVQARPADRMGLLVFSQRPYLACPLTFDHNFLRQRLHDLETGLIPDGTDLAGALVSGTGQLADSTSPRRVLVLFSDGEANVDAPLSPLQAASLAEAAGLIVYTVGVGGSHAFVRRPGLVRDRFVPIPAERHEGLLRQLAKRTGGEYLRATDAADFAAALHRIDQLERAPVEHLAITHATDLSATVLLASLVLLLTGLVLSRTRWLTIP